MKLFVELVQDAQGSLGGGVTAGKKRVKANGTSTAYIIKKKSHCGPFGMAQKPSQNIPVYVHVSQHVSYESDTLTRYMWSDSSNRCF